MINSQVQVYSHGDFVVIMQTQHGTRPVSLTVLDANAGLPSATVTMRHRVTGTGEKCPDWLGPGSPETTNYPLEEATGEGC